MRNGKRDRLIKIQSFSSDAVNEYGTPGQGFTDVGRFRAQLIETNTQEFIEAYGANAETITIFRIRYVTGVKVSDRVVYNGQNLNIIGIKELGRRKGLELRTELSVGS